MFGAYMILPIGTGNKEQTAFYGSGLLDFVMILEWRSEGLAKRAKTGKGGSDAIRE
jgi:hypothetical protein